MVTPTADVVAELQSVLGAAYVRTDADARSLYGTDALKRGHPADVVVFPGSTAEVAAIVRICAEHRLHMSRRPIVPPSH